jgi:hypothetical protein
VIEALLIIDGEGGSFLPVERAQTHELAPTPLERYATRDDLADRQPRPDLVEKRIGELHEGARALSRIA